MISITAGHRGKGTGAIGYIDEGEETIIFRNLLLNKLIEKGLPFIYEGEKESLQNVVNKLKLILHPNDISIDIHFNSSNNKSVSGSEIIIPDKYSKIEKELANDLLNKTCEILNTKNRKVKTESQTAHKKLAMLRGFNCINILIEICFVSNKSDCELYLKNKEKLAEEYSIILEEFYNKIN